MTGTILALCCGNVMFKFRLHKMKKFYSTTKTYFKAVSKKIDQVLSRILFGFLSFVFDTCSGQFVQGKHSFYNLFFVNSVDLSGSGSASYNKNHSFMKTSLRLFLSVATAFFCNLNTYAQTAACNNANLWFNAGKEKLKTFVLCSY